MAGKILVPRILWFALFLSTWVYLYVLDLAAVQGEPNWEGLSTWLSIAAVVTGAASLFGPRLLVKRANGGSSENQYLVGLILALALAETVAIYGLILGFEGAPLGVVLPFFVATWILMLIRFPTEGKMAQWE